MAYKRILTVQDISCVGQCSMTVALPILSACGHETCILPTAVLSTHTGEFGKPARIHLGDIVEPFCRHWQENDISFDAILVGYIGDSQGVQMVSTLARKLLSPDGLLIVDPAFADNGKIYSGLDEEYASQMHKLCRQADIILPNITEAAMFAGMEYQERPDEDYVKQLLETLGHPNVILTGVGYGAEETGVVVYQDKSVFHYVHPKVERSFHGTGDIFASCFTGVLLQERTIPEAAQTAADFVFICIENTVQNPAHWYGVKFETALPKLIHMINR
ncbi:MAG: pyridoxamine kinase [Oscillospiraceae bacterium]|nr:pyridoxamine kinase [Oscillospiraceae bacterium]